MAQGRRDADDRNRHPARTTFPLQINAALMATYEDVRAALGSPTVRLLDNRDRVEWLAESSSPYGVDFAPRKGRIPGAVWIEWYDFMTVTDNHAAFRNAEDIRALAASRGLRPDDDIIIYCFKGRARGQYLCRAGIRRVQPPADLYGIVERMVPQPGPADRGRPAQGCRPVSRMMPDRMGKGT